ncbi:MAG TPA: glycoside hydrolase family 172 protein [Actinopolymorphaceae bacterium]
MDGLQGLARVSKAVTRSISAENPTGEKGQGGRATEGTGASCARDLGIGWKISPSIKIEAGTTATLADISGAGTIQHIWLTTHPKNWRSLLLRFSWDGDARPAIEVPVGDFFGQGWGRFAQLSSLPVAVNPHGGFNCYWPMPFASGARITLENIATEDAIVYYQVDYELDQSGATDTDGLAYFHAQWRRSNPLPYKEVHTLLDGISGTGHYVGTYLAWGVNSVGWWGEGEIKFYLDGDEEFPTICGTGTEDYFGGAWNFDVPGKGYTEFSTPYLGLHQVIRPDGLYDSQQRFGMYRWHVADPIRFASDIRVTIQALGWRSGGRYLPLQDDISSTAFFYGTATSYDKPGTPDFDTLEIC